MELMVAMAIGLMLVLMVTNYMISSRQSYQTSVANGDVQDARRFALHVVQQQLWLAGYSDRWEDLSDVFPSFTSPDGSGIPPFEAGQVVGADADDEVWIRYRAPALEGQPLTLCDGTRFSDDDNADEIAISRFYLEDRTLRCKVYFENDEAHDSLPLLNDVDALQWRYLDDSDHFQPVEGVNWSAVKAIQFEMILASADSSGTRYAQTLPWGDSSLTYDDGHTRTHLSSTIALRNLPETTQ